LKAARKTEVQITIFCMYNMDTEHIYCSHEQKINNKPMTTIIFLRRHIEK
jgi:hypothetical protein